MGYHHNPIEPSDWTYGPDYLEEGDCHNCDGTGEVVNPNDEEMTCPSCEGSGFSPHKHFDDDVM